MVVLSLFDGISCGRVALEKAGVNVEKYYASEIDEESMRASKNNYPDIIQIGDICSIGHIAGIDLLIGGSPCQGFSSSGSHKGLKDPRSKLFYEYLRIKNTVQPKWWLFENVIMDRKSQGIISNELGCEPLKLDAKSISAQRRNRLYWTNIPYYTNFQKKPKTMKDVLNPSLHLEDITDRFYAKKEGTLAYVKSRKQLFSFSDQAYSMPTQGQRISNTGATNIKIGNRIYIYNADGAEVMHGLPEGYTRGFSKTSRYKMIGNGWHVDIVADIFRALKNEK